MQKRDSYIYYIYDILNFCQLYILFIIRIHRLLAATLRTIMESPQKVIPEK
jgi:hypothetical protein